MMTEDDILNVSLHVDERQNMHAVPHVDLATFDPNNLDDVTKLHASMRYIVNMNAIEPDWRALMASAQLMYRTLHEHQQIFESLVRIMEDGGQDEIAMALTVHMTANQLARRCAIEGPEILLPKSN